MAKSADPEQIEYSRSSRKGGSLSLAGKQVRHLFLAEGGAEEGLVNALLRRQKTSPTTSLVGCLKGIQRLHDVLRALVTEPEWADLHSVTILLDADDNPQGRLSNTWDALGEIVGITEQSVAAGKQRGWTLSGGTRYALWLNPGKSRRGTIEDLVLDTLDPKARDCIATLWHCATGHAKAREPSPKAEVAVWLALRADLGLGLGTAFERGLIDLDHRAFEPLRQLIDEQLSYRGSPPAQQGS